jgi:hypothetical protein
VDDYFCCCKDDWLILKDSVKRNLKEADTVLFEGPLDPDNMAAVVRAGMVTDIPYHLFDDLDPKAISGLTTALAPVCRDKHSFIVFNQRIIEFLKQVDQ